MSIQDLDGKSVFPNCCVLRIDFSKMLTVNVKYNNDKSRDYTNPTLPSGDETLPSPALRAAATGVAVKPSVPPTAVSAYPSPQLPALGGVSKCPG